MDKLNTKEWIFLVALGVIVLSIFLPFISVLGNSISLFGLLEMVGHTWICIILLLGTVGCIGLFFWKKKVSAIVSLILCFSVPLFAFIVRSSESAYPEMGGIFGLIFGWPSYGQYILVIGIIGTLISSILLLTQEFKNKKVTNTKK